MSDARYPVLFPIEISSRELDYRLILAAELADPARTIYVGKSSAITRLARNMSGGIYWGKNVIIGGETHNLRDYHMIKQKGFLHVQLSEEGAINITGKRQWKEMLLTLFDPRMQAEEDYVCAWGQLTADFYQSLDPACRRNIHPTGHPRFDLCKKKYAAYYQPEADVLKAEFGRYILVNSSFTYGNNFQAMEDCFVLFGVMTSDDVERRVIIDRFSFYARLQAHLIGLTSRLSEAFPDHQIIFRPHPGENQQVYKEVLKFVPRVHVLHRGGSLPWILGAESLVHCGCTTGMEGYELVPSIVYYKPISDERFDPDLPAYFGKKCNNEDEVIEFLKTGAATPDLASADRVRIQSIIRNYGSDRTAIEAFREILIEAEGKLSGSSIPSNLDRGEKRRLFLQKTKANWGMIRGKLGSKGGRSRTSSAAKFAPFSEENLRERFERISKLVARPFRWKRHSEELLSVDAG